MASPVNGGRGQDNLPTCLIIADGGDFDRFSLGGGLVHKFGCLGVGCEGGGFFDHGVSLEYLIGCSLAQYLPEGNDSIVLLAPRAESKPFLSGVVQSTTPPIPQPPRCRHRTCRRNMSTTKTWGSTDCIAYSHFVNVRNDNCNNRTNSHKNIVNANNGVADGSPEIMPWLPRLDAGTIICARMLIVCGIGFLK